MTYQCYNRVIATFYKVAYGHSKGYCNPACNEKHALAHIRRVSEIAIPQNGSVEFREKEGVNKKQGEIVLGQLMESMFCNLSNRNNRF